MLPNSPVIAKAQALVLPDFSGLPEWAQGILYLVLAIGLALSVLIPRMGFLSGREATKNGTGSTSAAMPLVVAAVADPTALNFLATAIKDHAEALRASGTATRELREEIKDLREELIRTNAKH